MLISVNGVRLFVDVANFGLVPDGDGMREKPTLLVLHGGPGWDHVGLKEAFASLGDVAQVVVCDLRGNGRSEGDDPATWTLAQWADDVKGLCDALGSSAPSSAVSRSAASSRRPTPSATPTTRAS